MILVLLPGGTFKMGSPDAGPDDDEVLHDARRSPVFLRQARGDAGAVDPGRGREPSVHRPGTDENVTLLHPVENVDWNEAADFVRRLDLTLPSETEWEFGCRAGTDTAFTWGDDAEVLEDAPTSAIRAWSTSSRGKASIIERAPWNDSFPHTAPVHALASNAFGIFGLHGNVGEWCRDWYLRVPNPDANDLDQPAPPYPRRDAILEGRLLADAAGARAVLRAAPVRPRDEEPHARVARRAAL